ncbi:MAG: amino acid decarboxylase [Roseburia sp.]|nr:amino acid decarboxylase [Roseburia sp.]
MQTPIADFVTEYANKNGSRFHMPGHKGQAFLGCEAFDITEIAGADALYEAEGIIAESEQNATELFGTARTVYSTEGSSQCIRAMMHLVVGYWKSRQAAGNEQGREDVGDRRDDKKQSVCMRPYIIAARNVHKAFLYAAALVDFDVVWLYPEEMHSLCSCKISAEQVEVELKKQLEERGMAPAAVYVTSPDYLGGQLNIAALAKVCRRYDTLLAVDNAHGAYLHFLENAQHPMDLGADICCDSAHKTLPVLTGGAYLHISKTAPAYFAENAKQAMVLFGSTSPSYLIMTSLDLCNAYLADGYREKSASTIGKVENLKADFVEAGWEIENTDPLKITIATSGYTTGTKLAEHLREAGIECEYADEEFVVLMVTPENIEEDYLNLRQALENFNSEKSWNAKKSQFRPVYCEQKLSIREAIFAEQEMVKAEDALGRICGVPTVGCPPAIPIVVPGEVINEDALRLFQHYDVETVAVIK